MRIKVAEHKAVLGELAEECPDLGDNMEGNDAEEEKKSTGDVQGDKIIDDLLSRIKHLEEKNEHWIEEVAAQQYHYGAVIQRQQEEIELRDKKDQAVALALKKSVFVSWRHWTSTQSYRWPRSRDNGRQIH